MAKVLYRPKTMMEIYKLLPERSPVQLINDHLYMSPIPLLEHFETIDAIVDALKNVYEKYGVKEYFTVEPSDKSVVTYYLRDGSFAEHKKTKGKLLSKLLKKTFSF